MMRQHKCFVGMHSEESHYLQEVDLSEFSGNLYNMQQLHVFCICIDVGKKMHE